jgi:hypothetical protein
MATTTIIEKAPTVSRAQAQQPYPAEYLLNETYSLLTRLNSVKPFSMTMPMVSGAAISDKAMKAITGLLEGDKRNLRRHLYEFIDNLKGSATTSDPQELQSDFTLLKLRFNSILDQLDIFADVLSQRAEHDVGIWLSGLDVLAEDGLAIIKELVDAPPLMVYLDRGHGAAIRRARTRLPGGDLNPVGVIQIPRERMVGSGIASSLIHEVGHQAAELLNIIPTLQETMAAKQSRSNIGWRFLRRWISEIIPDVWALGHLGITATMGLMGVVSLPKYFQFRLDVNDPHPAPYVRVQLSCAFGKKMFASNQWDRLWELWKLFYPKQNLKREILFALDEIDKVVDDFTSLVLSLSTKEMKGKKFIELFEHSSVTPDRLKQAYKQWQAGNLSLNTMHPTLLFAVLGQAKFDLVLNATAENQLLTKELRRWAFLRS